VDVRCDPFTVTFTFAAVNELLEHVGDVSAPVRAITAAMSQERRVAFWRRLAGAARAYADAGGVVRLPNDCLIVAGRR
jgi:hypothetical protein